MSDSSHFPATDWPAVEVLRNRLEHTDNECVTRTYTETRDRFWVRYWKPVFYYFRARGATLQQAEDWTQEFFLTHLVEGDRIARADASMGSLRNWLMLLMRQFASDNQPANARRQDAFEANQQSFHFVIGDEESTWEPAAGDTPETVFEHRWAAEIVTRAYDQLARQYPENWPLFEAYYLAGADKRPTHQQLALLHGVDCPTINRRLERTRKTLKRLIRAELRQTGVRADEMETEVAALLEHYSLREAPSLEDGQ